MEITLIRHGQSLWTENKSMTSHEFKKWVEQYDSKGVSEETSYPQETLEKIKAAAIVITSDLKRSLESAEYLKPNVTVISNSLFRETEMPFAQIGGLRLHASMWAVILRCLWFMGYSNGCESVKEAKRRAEAAAKFLVERAEEHQSVVLVGHGFFNRMIARELKKYGWIGNRKMSAKHWDSTTFWLEY
ncbi:histidine phosphatase family protein [Bacillus sp. FJAT-29814]|uniref:histidine phosphatase family protein n=1 Tax=Bacillus sp. FJAT-29814 TaxID=1729688 RepID=UPI00082AC28B|nr:histidine phosphatase family protein [Bacillus sp. FJAT-29814]